VVLNRIWSRSTWKAASTKSYKVGQSFFAANGLSSSRKFITEKQPTKSVLG